MPSPQVEIAQAIDRDLPAVRELLTAYAESLGYRACFHEFERELDGLPGPYGPPSGRLLVARRADGNVVGLVAIAPAEEGACEMRRLFLRNEYRGRGIGRRLVEAALAAAAGVGYRKMRLETLPEMAAARALYLSLGFAAAPPDPARAEVLRLERALAGQKSITTA